jgi:hypothetical protein
VGRIYIMGQTGNTNYGYIGGDLGTSGRTNFDRIDYSNDTATAVLKSNGLSGLWALAATGNSNFGYWTGGGGSPAGVSRLDYSNDSLSASSRGNLANSFTYHGAFSNTFGL